ncbi:MAG: 5-oxoprolinase subunit PxpA [Flammeovirgaceae bacterium]|nr:5-oxoprolinase subunit PxpA [Flammeovirgaceae bacterium]
MKHIDINCDLGEGIGNDAQLMPYLSSCNVACGGHAGNEQIMIETVELAKFHNTKIGAHPSFPDRENFGRLDMEISPRELTKVLVEQIELLSTILSKRGLKLNHVKAHGALYNKASVDEPTANAIILAMTNFTDLKIYAPWKSVLAHVACNAKIDVMYEAFADRNYNSDLTLVSRKLPNALLHDPDEIATHVLRMIVDGKVKTVSHQEVNIKADTLCIHGDNPDALTIVKHLHKTLEKHDIRVS